MRARPQKISGQDGFSLIELSIVLVITGLLIGGVLVGQTLVKAAELRAVTTEFQQWQTAMNVFRQKYSHLPGDFDEATQFWSGTANGNGNERITAGELPDEDEELFLFWQHLSLAGMIPDVYSGVAGSGGTAHVIPGENAPESRYGGGWTATTREGGSGARYDYEYYNVFLIGAASASSLPQNKLFPPEDAWNIDAKFDDGKPGTGNVIALYWSVCANSTSNTDYEKDYALDDPSIQCALYFRNAI